MLGIDWYWDKIDPLEYATENKLDVRWRLKKKGEKRNFGSLRIVDHPDLKPGHLRSHVYIIKSTKPKTNIEKMQIIKDYFIGLDELEVYSVDEHVEMEHNELVATKKELEEIYQVKIFS